jgi:hypothetical protein
MFDIMFSFFDFTKINEEFKRLDTMVSTVADKPHTIPTMRSCRLIREHHTPSKDEYKPNDSGGKKKKKNNNTTTQSDPGQFESKKFYEFMTYVAAFMEKFGWISSADRNRKSIAELAYDECGSTFTSSLKVMDYHSALARRAIKWAASLTDNDVKDTEYLNAIRRLARIKRVNFQNYKHAGSIVNAYNKNVLGGQPKGTDENSAPSKYSYSTGYNNSSNSKGNDSKSSAESSKVEV